MVSSSTLLLILVISPLSSLAVYQPNYAIQNAPRVAFDVSDMEICKDLHDEVCAEISWSAYEASEYSINILADRRRNSRWYLLQIECDKATIRFEMRKMTTQTVMARLVPFKNYTARVYSMNQDQASLLRNFSFETIIAAPSAIEQLTVEVLDRNIAHMPLARKLQLNWQQPVEAGARQISGYVIGLYKKPEFSFRAASYKNTTIMEVETNQTWQMVEPVGFYEKRLFVRVRPYNLLLNGSLVYGRETVADVLLKSQYSRELSVNSVGSQSVDIDIDRDIFKDIQDVGLITNISVYVSPVEAFDWMSWKAEDYTRAVQEDTLKNRFVRSVYRVSPYGWSLGVSMDKRRGNYLKFPCYQGVDRRKITCSVGVDEKCDKQMFNQICNGPLITGANYTVFVRATLKKSNYLPEYDDSKPLLINLQTLALTRRWQDVKQPTIPHIHYA